MIIKVNTNRIKIIGYIYIYWTIIEMIRCGCLITINNIDSRYIY